MIVRKLRLKKGWSQEQLAQISGLNVRTIQRIERGHSASLESKKSLAAAFEVQLLTFNTSSQEAAKEVNNENEAIDMTNLEHKADQNVASAEIADDTDHAKTIEELKADEKYALNYAKGISEFYQHLLIYGFVNAIILYNIDSASGYLPWGLGGWTFGLILHGLNAFEVLNFLNADWERKVAEKKLGRKL